MVRGLVLLKVGLVLVLVVVLVLLLVLRLRDSCWVVENLLSSLLNIMDGLGRVLRRGEKAAGLGMMMRSR